MLSNMTIYFNLMRLFFIWLMHKNQNQNSMNSISSTLPLYPWEFMVMYVWWKMLIMHGVFTSGHFRHKGMSYNFHYVECTVISSCVIPV